MYDLCSGREAVVAKAPKDINEGFDLIASDSYVGSSRGMTWFFGGDQGCLQGVKKGISAFA